MRRKSYCASKMNILQLPATVFENIHVRETLTSFSAMMSSLSADRAATCAPCCFSRAARLMIALISVAEKSKMDFAG